MDHYTFMSQSDMLKNKEDYTFLEVNKLVKEAEQTKSYEIKLINHKKIITGIAIPYYCDIVLPTRTVKNVLEVGLTFEESLYFYAFGIIKIEVKKHED